MKLLDALERGRRRTENADGVSSDGIQKVSDLSRHCHGLGWIAIGYQNAGERGKRRIEHRLPISRLPGIKILEPLSDGKLERVVIREIALNHDLSRLITAARAACDLSQQLKRSLGGTKVRH